MMNDGKNAAVDFWTEDERAARERVRKEADNDWVVLRKE